jgi:hypothetical protein
VAIDYRKFCDLEHYLFTEVGPHFAKTGKIRPADFYIIVIWKANRAKTKVRNRLSKRKGGFATSVKSIAWALNSSSHSMERLRIMMEDWDFALPMATAILTVFYPKDFSVYDARVCGQVKGSFEKLAHRRFSDTLWNDYRKFLRAVKAAAPASLSLRDKDHYLWGCSFYQDVMNDLGPRRHGLRPIGAG